MLHTIILTPILVPVHAKPIWIRGGGGTTWIYTGVAYSIIIIQQVQNTLKHVKFPVKFEDIYSQKIVPWKMKHLTNTCERKVQSFFINHPPSPSPVLVWGERWHKHAIAKSHDNLVFLNSYLWAAFRTIWDIDSYVCTCTATQAYHIWYASTLHV